MARVSTAKDQQTHSLVSEQVSEYHNNMNMDDLLSKCDVIRMPPMAMDKNGKITYPKADPNKLRELGHMIRGTTEKYSPPKDASKTVVNIPNLDR
jgi:hypothetical protein